MSKVPTKVREIREAKLKAESGSKNISFSQLSLYLSCPHRWYRAYIKKEAPYTPSIHTTFGTALHETLQKWLDILYNDSVKNATAFDMNSYLVERMKAVYRKDRAILGKDFSSSKELNEFCEDGFAILDFIQKHRKAYFSSKKVHLVGCEIPILYELKPKFYFKGFIDVLLYDEELDKWKILDIKTSTSGWNAETKGDFNKISQVLLYKNYLAELFGIDKEKIEVEYFIVKRKVPEEAEFPAMKKRVQEFLPSQGPRNTKKAVNLVESFISGALTETGEYQEREYEATPSKDNCKWCLFKDSCKFVVTV